MQEGAYAAKTQGRQDLVGRNPRPEKVYRRRRVCFALGLVAACLVITGIVLATTASGTTVQIGEQSFLAGSTHTSTAPVTATGQERPVFARLDDRNLLLPVAASDVTIIAYQAVSDERAVPLTPIGDQANSNALVRFFRGIFASEPAVRYYILEGSDGEPTTSVLVGALPGSPVYAPISGMITGIKEYLLYGKYTDVRVDIRPEKSSGITISLLFIDAPTVSIGDVVTAGKTQLGKVRECPQELGQTLGTYTHDSGSHVNLQVLEEPIS